MKRLISLMSMAAFMLTATTAFAVDCAEDADCDDSNACTTDTCTDGVCANAPVDDCCLLDADCADGEVCVENVCMPDPTCATDTDCDDNNVCTTDTCTDGVCANAPVDGCCLLDAECAANEVCVENICVPDVQPDCVTDDDCADGEVCIGGVCLAGGPDSCVGLCGGQAETCYCDDACFEMEDCCADVCDACPELIGCCVPDCTGKACGDDGCGGDCGDCEPGFKCENFECVVCEPDCAGKICGPDGCGGSCGDCPDGKSCNLDGTECFDCVGCAPWQTCDAAGACIDPPPAGNCGYGGQYIAEGCFGVDWLGCCAGDVLYFCDDQSGACPLGATCLVVIYCGENGAACGWMEEFFNCVEGDPQPSPSGDLYCDHYECTPSCAGKVCGDDGCGGECGTCDIGMFCAEDGQCVGMTCEGFCGEKSPGGCWCDDECSLPENDDCCDDRCEFCPEVCGGDECVATCAAVECGMVEACDCGACDTGMVCEANVCVPDGPCVPDCTDKVCGDDGCGSSCGECGDGETCEDGLCVIEIAADVVDTECATDDDCGDGEVCNADGACETAGGGGDDDGDSGGCATGGSAPMAGFLVLFGVLGLAVIRRRVTA